MATAFCPLMHAAGGVVLWRQPTERFTVACASARNDA
jgi:hypothetical protein